MKRVLWVLAVVPLMNLATGCTTKKCTGTNCESPGITAGLTVGKGGLVQLAVSDREARVATLIDGFGEAARPTFWLADHAIDDGTLTIVASDDAPAGIHTLVIDHGSSVTTVDVEVR